MRFSTDSGAIDLPCFFASISSLKTFYSVLQYLRVLAAAPYQTLLVSAFDLARLPSCDVEPVRSHLNKAIAAGHTVLLDSGNYESYWVRDAGWDQTMFHQILNRFPCSLAFSYDGIETKSHGESARTLEWLHVDSKAAAGVPIIPILHGTPESLPVIAAEIASSSGVTMVAMPERELGSGVLDRARTLKEIRVRMDAVRRGVHIHLLGTGNPLSIGIYTIVGAQTFDGLEWCQTAVNTTDGTLHHLSHWELLPNLESAVVRQLPKGIQALVSNLTFFDGWMKALQKWAADGECPQRYMTLLDAARGAADRAVKNA